MHISDSEILFLGLVFGYLNRVDYERAYMSVCTTGLCSFASLQVSLCGFLAQASTPCA